MRACVLAFIAYLCGESKAQRRDLLLAMEKWAQIRGATLIEVQRIVEGGYQ